MSKKDSKKEAAPKKKQRQLLKLKMQFQKVSAMFGDMVKKFWRMHKHGS